MAKKKATAADFDFDEDQGDLFVELDEGKAEHKTLIGLAKKHAKIEHERTELLKTSKAKSDDSKQKLLDQMHKLEMKAFRHKGVQVTIIDGHEKVEIKTIGSKKDRGGDSGGDDDSGDDE